jgi:hypothetical protein
VNILPQITQITQTNAAGLHYFAEKDRLSWLWDPFGYSCFCSFGFCLRKSAKSAGDIGVSLCRYIEYSHVNILPQIAQMTQRNAASCIISQRKTVSLRLRLFCCFVVNLRKSARSAGDIGVSFVWIDRVLLREYSPADYAEDAEECSKLHYFAEKDRLGWLWDPFGYSCFCSFGFCLRLSA